MADATAAEAAYEHAYASLVMFRALLNASGDLAFLIRASPWSVQYVAARVITLCCGPGRGFHKIPHDFPPSPHSIDRHHAGSGSSMADCATNVTWELVLEAILPFTPVPMEVSREAAIAGAAFFPGEPVEEDEATMEEWDGNLSVSNFADYMARTKTVAPADAGDADISPAFMARVITVFSENPTDAGDADISSAFMARVITVFSENPASPLPSFAPIAQQQRQQQQRQQGGHKKNHDEEEEEEEELLKTYIWKMAAYVCSVKTIPWAEDWDTRRSTVTRAVWRMGGTRSNLTGRRGKVACLQKAFLACVILCAVCGNTTLEWSGGRCKFGMDMVFESGKVASLLGQCLHEGACMIHKLMMDGGRGDSSPSLAPALQFWTATCRLEVERCASLSIGSDRSVSGGGSSARDVVGSALKEYYSGPAPRFPSLSHLFTRRERMEIEDGVGGCSCRAEGGVKEHAALVSLAHGACHNAEALRPDAVVAWFVARGAFGVELPEELLAGVSPAAFLVDKSLFRDCKWGHMRPGTEFHRRIVYAARVYRGAESSHRQGGSLRLLPCSHEDFVAQWAIALVMQFEAVTPYVSPLHPEEKLKPWQEHQQEGGQGGEAHVPRDHQQGRGQRQMRQGQGQGLQQRQGHQQGGGLQQRQGQRQQMQMQGFLQQGQGQGEWSIFGNASAWLKRLF